MKRTLFFFAFLVSIFCSCDIYAQIITTYAGGVTGSPVDNVPATSTSTSLPGAGVFDALGNYYFVSAQNRIRKITASGVITTVVGTGTGTYGGDNGSAIAAQIHCQGIHVDSIGNIYIADYYNFRLRKVDAITGIIQTIGGTGFPGSSGNGGSATAALMAPTDVITDDTGNIYILENYNLRKISASTNIITQIASGNGWMCFDANYDHLYYGSLYLIRMTMATGVIDTIAGTGLAAYNGDEILATSANFRILDIALDADGNIYIADDVNDRIRKIDAAGIIHTVAGTGTGAYGGDNGPATAAQLWNPQGLAFDKCGNLYIADDNNHRVRKVAFNPSCIPPNAIKEVVQNELVFFPNPVTNLLHISNTQPGITYALYELTGRVVATGVFNKKNDEIDMSHLASSIYLLQVRHTDGTRETYKIIKQ